MRGIRQGDPLSSAREKLFEALLELERAAEVSLPTISEQRKRQITDSGAASWLPWPGQYTRTELAKAVIKKLAESDPTNFLWQNSLSASYDALGNVLMAAQEYSEGGCQIPDGYVEPAPAVYDSLITYAARGEAVLTQLDPANRTGSTAYFRELQRTLKVLRGIAQSELLGLPLSEQQQRFLAMIAEMKPGNSGRGPTYTGWYFDLFRGRWEEALGDTAFVTD